MERVEKAFRARDFREQTVFEKAVFSIRDERRHIAGSTFEAHERYYRQTFGNWGASFRRGLSFAFVRKFIKTFRGPCHRH